MEDGAQVAVRIGLMTLNALRLDGLRTLLEADGGYKVLSVSEPGWLDGGEPAAVLLDVESTEHPEGLLREFRRGRPNLRVLLLGPETSPEGIARAIALGAKGYLEYSADEKTLRRALAVVIDGSMWAPRKVLAQLLEQTQGPGAKAGARVGEAGTRLTLREREVLGLLLQGHPNRVIAKALGVNEVTVKAHIGRLLRKRGVTNRTALSMQALGLLADPAVDG